MVHITIFLSWTAQGYTTIMLDASGLSDGCIFVVVGSTIVTCSLCWHLAFVFKFFPFKVFCVICTSFICPYNKLTLREPVNDVYGLYMMYKARNHVPIPCLF